ncbi:efflux RND transporter periplasmic adaptor subunit [Actibacterium sp. 188UL27-1]|uniref:efflux RND transporter periplasmic adaptor subunit n=1 Tax=Actibacterium sp. 188UL27-1 TaxID=2786961 RepID=UPI00195DB3B3|nr:HlyD family efflux transporter periplasmic adaptor subunit [Actibacterium sp. 188UL27-1]MBM7069287.1 HlyD family efflux transporter periplasmic adaptor subunit [Actibacterium sp. 188UL27-1]
MNDQIKRARITPQPEGDNKLKNALGLLQLEAEIRQITTVDELEYHMVNASQDQVGYEQAFLVYRIGRRLRIRAASAIVTVERNAPAIVWLEKTLNTAVAEAGPDPLQWVLPKHADPAIDDTTSYPFKGFFWVPFAPHKGRPPGGLLFVRKGPWFDRQKPLARHLVDTYDHALRALTGKRHPGKTRLARKVILATALVALALASILPVPLTALAPATITGRDPAVVAAPLEGVIAEIAVSPNQPVTTGQTLFRFEDTELRNAHQIARQEVAVAEAELAKLRSGSFLDPSVARDIATAEATLAVATARAALAEQRLNRATVTADVDGVAIFGDTRDLVARPVAIGEQIMELVDPARLEVSLNIAISDQAVMAQDAPVRVFLDANPLAPIEAQITRISYRGTLQDDGTLAYDVRAQIAANAPALTLGARGMASISGDTVPLWYAVLRRPLSWLRQTTGF